MWGSCFSLGSRRGSAPSPPPPPPPPPPPHSHSSLIPYLPHSHLISSQLTHSLIHSLTHSSSLIHSLIHSLTHLHSLPHSLTHLHSSTHSLIHSSSLTHSLRQVQYRELPACLSRGRCSTQSLLDLRRAWSPLGRGCLSRGRRSTQSLLRAWSPPGPRLPFAWQAQDTEPPGGAAARVIAAGAAAAFRVAGAVHRASWRSCGARGRR